MTTPKDDPSEHLFIDECLAEFSKSSTALWLTEKKARMLLESSRQSQIVGLVIRHMDTGQTTVIDQSAVRTFRWAEWDKVMRPAMSPHEHHAWNAKNHPGTRQLCILCDEETERCEEDAFYADSGVGPLCQRCFHEQPTATQ